MYREKFRKKRVGSSRINISGDRVFSARTGQALGHISLGLFGILMLSMLFPVVNNNANAEEPSTETVMTTSVNTNMTTLVRSSIAVALSSSVDLDVTPKARGAFSTSTANLKVTTNNTTGYKVYMQTTDNTSELKATNPQVNERIAPVSGTMTEDDFSNNLNTWGYAIDTAGQTMAYQAVPKAGEEAIVETTGISREDDYTLGFAVAVGSDLPAGLYTNQLVLSVLANPVEVRSLNDIEYMQDMTPEICAITFIGEEKSLIDKRDNKAYKVAKLKDGNCWMTQNLALDIALDDEGNAAALAENGTKTTLDETNSDMKGKWGKDAAYPPRETRTELGSDKPTISAFSWRLQSASERPVWRFYQFMAATGGVSAKDGESVNQSICPYNWTLPDGGANGAYANLLQYYNIDNTNPTAVADEPLNFAYSGHITPNSSDNAFAWWNEGNYGFYWTNLYVRTIMFNKTLVSPNHGVMQASGMPIRCVAK